MAVFFDTGGGDIYAGPTKDAVIQAIKSDVGEDEFKEEIMDGVFEVSGTTKMRVSEGVTPPVLSTLNEQYDAALGSYCIASENC